MYYQCLLIVSCTYLYKNECVAEKRKQKKKKKKKKLFQTLLVVENEKILQSFNKLWPFGSNGSRRYAYAY
jgi:hypothetical protein